MPESLRSFATDMRDLPLLSLSTVTGDPLYVWGTVSIVTKLTTSFSDPLPFQIAVGHQRGEQHGDDPGQGDPHHHEFDIN